MNLSKFKIDNGIYFYNDIPLKETTNTQGYRYVRILGKKVRLHRIIAMKYIFNPNDLKIVGHKDGIKSNNDVSNLYWTTYSENIKKAIKANKNILRMHKGTRGVVAKKENLTINFKSVRQASRILNRDVAAIARCCRGEWQKCNGFNLKYAEL